MHQNSHINLRCCVNKKDQAKPYFALFKAIEVPVFCSCLIAAIGSATGVRHVTTMQFDVDRNTEFILFNYVLFKTFDKN